VSSQGEVPTLSSRGYVSLLVSSPQLMSASDPRCARYQPVDYRIIAGPLVGQIAFKSMIDKAHAHGLKVIVDVVLKTC
jgi:glycosidase